MSLEELLDEIARLVGQAQEALKTPVPLPPEHPVLRNVPDLTAVTGLQVALNRFLAVKPLLKVDGVLNNDTQEALRATQQELGLVVTGVPDVNTLAALAVALHNPADKP